MSMNLQILVDGRDILPIQIGTHDTYIILTDDKGNVGEIKGKKVLGALKRLQFYIDKLRQNEFNCYSNDPERQKEISEQYADLHRNITREVTMALKEKRKVVFFYM